MPYMEDCLDWPLSTVLPLLQQRIMEGSSYHGIPTMKSPLDFWIYQEILWETRPAFIIEIGNLYGGSTLALAHACDALGKGKIIGMIPRMRTCIPVSEPIDASRCLRVMHVKCIPR